MNYKEKPQLHLYEYKNNSFIQTAIIDDYQEISFEHNLYEAGNFTITINYNIPNALKFERGMFIQFGNNPYMFGEILRINDSIGEDGKGSQIRSITGKDARFLFKRRIIKNLNNEENWIMTDKGEICLRNLVKDQCGTNAETKRQLPITNTIPATADAVGKEYSVSESYTNLYDTLVTIATQSEIGWRIKFDGSMTLECYEGSDISNQVQFSTEFDSLSSGQFSDSSESYANSIYIGGKGIGAERDIYEGENSIEGASPSGLDRYEAWDNQSEMTSESEYEAEALSMLAQYGQTVTVSGKGLVQCPYIFQEQYDIGDVITIAFSGKSAKAQILAVTEHWTWGRYSLEFSFGKPQNDLARQLQLILKQIQKASSKTTVTASVKWYTMTSDTVQDKSDVIYDTIGFTGAMTSNKTFTFYLDDEKTGAKSYNIYAKNLSGNYTLTLTTGVSGASNFTIKGGSNIVARILVDENGNIVSQSMTATDLIESGNNQPATSNAVAGALDGKLNNTMPSIQGSDVDNLSASEMEVYKVSNYGIGWQSNDGMIIHLPWSKDFAYQIAVDDQTNWLAVRCKASGSWQPWKILSGAEGDDSSPVDISSSVSKSLGVKSVTACRRNNLVYIYIYGTYTGSPTTATQSVVSGLPDKYLPKFEQTFCVASYASGNFVYPSRIIVTGNCIFIGETSMPNGSEIRMGFIYIGA